MIYRARLYWLINCLNGGEWLWPAGQLATLIYGPWPTSELSRPGKPACFRRWQVCLSVSVTVSLSLSLSLYIYMQWSPVVSLAAPPLTSTSSAAQCRFWLHVGCCVLLRGVSFWSLVPVWLLC